MSVTREKNKKTALEERLRALGNQKSGHMDYVAGIPAWCIKKPFGFDPSYTKAGLYCVFADKTRFYGMTSRFYEMDNIPCWHHHVEWTIYHDRVIVVTVKLKPDLEQSGLKWITGILGHFCARVD